MSAATFVINIIVIIVVVIITITIITSHITITEFELHRLQTWSMNSDSVEKKLQWGERERESLCVRACV